MARQPQAPFQPSGTSRLFSGPKAPDRAAGVTRERIAHDLAVFEKAGGRIEVLGNTRVLRPSEILAEVTADPPPTRRAGK